MQAEVDENLFVVPANWSGRIEPFRGRGSSPPSDLARAPRNTADAQADDLQADAPELTQLHALLGFDRRDLYLPPGLSTVRRRTSVREFIEAAERHDSGNPDALGAAVLLAATDNGQHQRYEPETVGVDDWVLDHGLPFAATAAAMLAHIRCEFGVLPARLVPPGSTESYANAMLGPALRRARRLLAGADDVAYQRAVKALGALRRRGPQVCCATSFLAPTQQDWVDDDIAAIRPSRWDDGQYLVLCSVLTDRQLKALLAKIPHTGNITEGMPGLLHTVCAQLGPDALPLLLRVYEENNADLQKVALNVIGRLPSDEALSALLDRATKKYVAPVLSETANRYPRRAVRVFARAANDPGGRGSTARTLLRAHLLAHPHLAAGPGLDAEEQTAITRSAASEVQAPIAPPAAVPDLLRTPPWQRSDRRVKPVVLKCPTPPHSRELVWAPGERETWLAGAAERSWDADRTQWMHRLERASDTPDYTQVWLLAHGPEDLVRPLLRSRGTPGHLTGDDESNLRRLLARFDAEALDYVIALAVQRPAVCAPVLLPVRAAELALPVAEWFDRLSTVRQSAREWLLRHPESAALGLLPAALGRAGRARTWAESALRLIDAEGHGRAVTDAAAAIGPAADDAVMSLLRTDPMDALPARMPSLPTWLQAGMLPPIFLNDGAGALPHDAVEALCLMFRLSRPDEVYAGIPQVLPAIEPGSLGTLVWGLFEQWRSAGFPREDAPWVFGSLGLAGDDEVARRLAPLIRAWPKDGASTRAVSALDVLGSIGSDVALMHLQSVAEKPPSRALGVHARAKVEEIAERLNLTPEQLGDRLVPRFDLGDDATLLLDYGARQFRVGFDAQLRPTVFDADGSPRTDLPKPSKGDDVGLAEAARSRFAALKKDVRAVASDQLRRFEHAMITSRRWTAAEHRRLFVDHPLLWHLTRGLVWLTSTEGGEVTGSFRFSEDRVPVDADGRQCPMSDETPVGIAHPIELGTDVTRVWITIFIEQGIVQPFAQLGREVYPIPPEQVTDPAIWPKDAVVEATRLLGLLNRGWRRETAMDGGIASSIEKDFGHGRTVVLSLDPGILAGDPTCWAEQTLLDLVVRNGPVTRVGASELMRDLASLVDRGPRLQVVD